MDLWLWAGMMTMVLWALGLAVRTDAAKGRLARLLVDGKDPGVRVVVASRWANRRVGLLNHAVIAPEAGLWLEGAKAVHGAGMLCAFDAVFLDGAGKVLAVHARLQPDSGRVAGPAGTKRIVELAAGAADRFGLRPGVALERAR